jgi:hypothetical protein
MKIKKLYDDEISQPQLDDFAADILEYFDSNDKILINMGSYNCGIFFKKAEINLTFQFTTLSQPELNCLLEIINYCKSFSKTFFYLNSQQINKGLNIIAFTIIFLKKDYSKIRADLDIRLKGKKYNIL